MAAKTVVPISVTADCKTATRSEVTMRDHRITIDEPRWHGGADAGAVPLEILMASLAGCTNVVSHLIAGEMKISLTDMTVAVDAPFRMAFVEGGGGAPFHDITLKVNARSDASPAEIETLKATLAERCPVSYLLRKAGCTIMEEWTISAPARS